MSPLATSLADDALRAANGSQHDAKRIIQRASYFSQIIAACCADIAPYDYQADFVDDYQSRAIIWRKPRGVGGSRSFGMKDVGKRLALPKSGGIHMSLNMDDAEQKINYIREIYERLSDEIELPRLTTNNKTELAWENGSSSKAVFNPRGKHKRDLFWDEMAHHPHARFIAVATFPALLRGGAQLAIGSTPTSKAAHFSEMWHGLGGKYQSLRRIETQWWECPAHCIDVALARAIAPNLSTEERVERFGSASLRDIFDLMLVEDFQCEFELVEMGDEDAWLSWELILACTPAGDNAVERWELTAV